MYFSVVSAQASCPGFLSITLVRGGTPSTPRCKKLLSDSQFFNQCTVSFDIGFLQVIQKTTSLTYHFQKTSSGMMIFVMCFQMLCQFLNSCCQYSYLYFR